MSADRRLLELAEELGCTIEFAGRYTGSEYGYWCSEPNGEYRITSPGWHESDVLPPDGRPQSTGDTA